MPTKAVLQLGPSPAAARRVVVACHGRGADAQDMLYLAEELALPATTFLAPQAWLQAHPTQAASRSWYPQSFLAPLAANQPYLDSSLQRLGELIDGLVAEGVDPTSIALMGFSQGACLALETAARRGKKLGGVVAFAGGRIGPPEVVWPAAGPGLAGMPVFLGCSDRDPHIPLWRVQETTAFFRAAGAVVDERIYKGLGHTVNADELAAARQLLERIGAAPSVPAQPNT